jgi:hypothetical protein
MKTIAALGVSICILLLGLAIYVNPKGFKGLFDGRAMTTEHGVLLCETEEVHIPGSHVYNSSGKLYLVKSITLVNEEAFVNEYLATKAEDMSKAPIISAEKWGIKVPTKSKIKPVYQILGTPL